MLGTTLRITCAVAALSLVVAAPALAGGNSVRRAGSCSGHGGWDLRVSRENAKTISVRFDIEQVHPGDSWQLFLSDDGMGIFAGTRIADPDGELRAIKLTSNRSGADQIKGSGVNVTAGGSCIGAVKF